MLEVEARYYRKQEDGKVKCELCPHYCVLAEGKTGICQGRKNIDGKLIAINYGRLCTLAIDPIEKKPMYHLHPGSRIISTGPNGCNLRCRFCQNWEISQGEVGTTYMSPEQLIERTLKEDSIGISYTYTEPLIWFEYLIDCCKLARENNLLNILVSNGMINPAPFRELLPYIDGMNIDLKSMDHDFYRKICGGDLDTVLEIIKLAAEGTMLEITNLLVTGENDSDEDISALIDFLASVNDEIPLHFSRYSPRYKMKNPPTPSERLFRAREIARKKMKYVYLGNIVDDESSTTYCPSCNEVLVRRGMFAARVVGLDDNKCSSCGYTINILL
jgi:pyruvate formate lyase activating enzyme